VKRAIRFLKTHAGDWGLDPAQIILMGSSTGGHLAALVGASAGALEPVVDASLASVDSSVSAIVDLAGISDFAAFAITDHASAEPVTAALLGCSVDGPAGCSSDLLLRASVAPNVDASDPPIFMVYGAVDELAVPATQGRPLAEAWETVHDGDEHSTTYSVIPAVGDDVEGHIDMARLSEFLDRNTGGAALVGRRVILYGDSLSWEAQGAFRDALLGAGLGEVVTRIFGGTAICDWLGLMRSDQEQLHPAAVVVEFSGNAFTPCMKDATGAPLSGDALLQKYADDALAALMIFDQDATLVYFASAPISLRADQTQDPQASRLNAIYASVSASYSWAHVVDAGTAVEDHGHWTGVLPCLAGEPCDGGVGPSGQPVNVVRAPDGVHFCPGAPGAVQGVTGSCPVWSSGAYRYGVALADPIARDLAYARPSDHES
jgi:hypothetical protein